MVSPTSWVLGVCAECFGLTQYCWHTVTVAVPQCFVDRMGLIPISACCRSLLNQLAFWTYPDGSPAEITKVATVLQHTVARLAAQFKSFFHAQNRRIHPNRMADLGVESLIRAVIAAGESSMILVLVSQLLHPPVHPGQVDTVFLSPQQAVSPDGKFLVGALALGSWKFSGECPLRGH